MLHRSVEAAAWLGRLAGEVQDTTEGSTRQLPIPAIAFGLLALAAFGALLLVTFAFRSVGHRH